MIWNIVIVSIMATLMVVMIITAKASKNSSDFFRSSGSMPWWLVGALGFVGQFSSWAFTGAQSEAYQNGMLVAFIFLANFLGFILTGLYFAPRARRIRAVTGSDAIRQRYGKNATVVLTVIRLITNLIGPAIRIVALGIVIAVVIHVSQIVAMLIAGIVIALFSAIGGIKILASFSFATTIVLMSITVLASVYALGHFGGDVLKPGKGLPGPITSISHAVFGRNFSSVWIPISWTIFIFIKQSTTVFSKYNGYNTVKNERSAKKSAVMSGVLMLAATLFWFIPSWAMHISDTDTSAWSTAAVMGSKVQESVYLEYLAKYMPVGFLGIIGFCLIISTVSSSGTLLNNNAANIVRNLRTPKHSKKKELTISKLTVVGLGIATLSVAVGMHYIKGFSLFDIMQVFTTSFGLPVSIPIILGFFFVRKTNDNIIWPTIAIGAVVSIVVAFIFNVDYFNAIFGAHAKSTEWPQIIVILTVALQLLITVPSYLLMAKFWKPKHSRRRELELEFFFRKMDTPLLKDSDEINKASSETAKEAYKNIIYFAIPVLAFAFIPESKLIYNFAYVFAAIFIAGIYFLMRYKTKEGLKRVIETPIYDPIDEMANEKGLEAILSEYIHKRENGKDFDWG